MFDTKYKRVRSCTVVCVSVCASYAPLFIILCCVTPNCMLNAVGTTHTHPSADKNKMITMNYVRVISIYTFPQKKNLNKHSCASSLSHLAYIVFLSFICSSLRCLFFFTVMVALHTRIHVVRLNFPSKHAIEHLTIESQNPVPSVKR